jgi:co-chaperonin GroES (HSP10)
MTETGQVKMVDPARIFKKILNGHIIVQVNEFSHKGRIIVPDTAQRKPTTGRVIAKAEDVEQVEIGDKLLYSQFAGYALHFEGYPMMRNISQEEVLAILNEDAPEIES